MPIQILGGAEIGAAPRAKLNKVIEFANEAAGIIGKVPQMVPIGFRQRGLTGSSPSTTAFISTATTVQSMERYKTASVGYTRAIRLGYQGFDSTTQGHGIRRNTATVRASIYVPAANTFKAAVRTQAASGATSITLQFGSAPAIMPGDKIAAGTAGFNANNLTYITTVAPSYAANGDSTGIVCGLSQATTAIITVNTVITLEGAIYQALSAGVATLTVPPSHQFHWFDITPVRPIPPNTTFYVKTFATFAAPAGIILADNTNGTTSALLANEGCATGTALTDNTRTPITPTNGGSGFFPPGIILAQTTTPFPSVVWAADSILNGWGDTADGEGRLGPVAKTFGNSIPHYLFGRTGGLAQSELNSPQPMQAVLNAANATHFIWSLGFNDIINNGVWETDILPLVQNLSAVCADMKIAFYVCTLTPKTTGTWTTLAGQTVTANESRRVLYNDSIRTNWKTWGITGVLDLADLVESARNSGQFRVDLGSAATTDGIHLTPIMVNAIVSANLFDPALFTV